MTAPQATIGAAVDSSALAALAAARYAASYYLRDTSPGVAAFYVALDTLSRAIREDGINAALDAFTVSQSRR